MLLIFKCFPGLFRGKSWEKCRKFPAKGRLKKEALTYTYACSEFLGEVLSELIGYTSEDNIRFVIKIFISPCQIGTICSACPSTSFFRSNSQRYSMSQGDRWWKRSGYPLRRLQKLLLVLRVQGHTGSQKKVRYRDRSRYLSTIGRR
jgi:hypothetical protein